MLHVNAARPIVTVLHDRQVSNLKSAPCKAIQADPELVYEHTNKANTIAIVSDGSRVLGLGNIGPEAGLPVMEGKALLFKYLGGVDAVPICLRTQDPEELIRTVKLLEPSFGGINLEDIAQPKCFRVLDTLRSEMNIPVWHDDQQGSSTVLLAGLLNALKLVDKLIGSIKIAMVGMEAANVAIYRLIKTCGVDPTPRSLPVTAKESCTEAAVILRKKRMSFQTSGAYVTRLMAKGLWEAWLRRCGMQMFVLPSRGQAQRLSNLNG